MTNRRMHLLTLCGSLQQRSANRAALDVASEAARERGATVDRFDRLDEIPAFNPERGEAHIDAVDDWRSRIDSADAVLIAAPEYAGGVSGAVKNALDWLVGSATMYRKPVGVISAGTTGGEHARRTLTQTLTWQGANVIADVGISAPRTKSDDDGRLTDAATIDAITRLVESLIEAVDA